jgi:hypothetical protein
MQAIETYTGLTRIAHDKRHSDTSFSYSVFDIINPTNRSLINRLEQFRI